MTTKNRSPVSGESPKKRRYMWWTAGPYVLSHLAVLMAFWSGVTWQAVVLCLVLYWGRILAVTAGYHRYFSHRTYKTSRWFQFLLAVWAQSSVQKGVLWWAAHHRAHHLYSDQPRDVHSPVQHSFFHSHVGWLFDAEMSNPDLKRVKDLQKFPELRVLDRLWIVVPILLGVACFLIAGWPGLFVGFFLSTVMCWHTTYLINSLAHVFGKRRFQTRDESRNHWGLALLAMGEGWHNNHHRYMNSARNGFYWWEIDVTFYLLKALEKVGLIWDLKLPPARVLAEGRRNDRRAVRAAAAERQEPATAEL
ncbi:MAG: acyl-CoA desaturase [Myxococcota bacterium]